MSPYTQPRHRRDDGFTLIELLIVIVILGVLAGIAIFAISSLKSSSSSAACVEDKRTIEHAIVGYKGGNNNANPTSLEQLTTGSSHYLDGDGVSGNTMTREGYTLTYTPSSGTVSDCDTALAAGGSGGSSGGSTGGTPTPTPTATATTPPTATSMTVALSSSASGSGSGSNHIWSQTVTVTVTDNLGAAVSGATVTGSWTFTKTGSTKQGTGTNGPSCSTTAAGTCTISGTDRENNVTQAVFLVDAVSKSGLTWTQTPPSISQNKV